MKALIVGAGVTGCFTSALLMQKGVDVSLLARGDKAARLERNGLHMRNGMTNEKANVRRSSAGGLSHPAPWPEHFTLDPGRARYG